MTLQPHHGITVPLTVAVSGMLALYALSIGGWPGDVGTSGMIFCEVSHGLIQQPANTWSNLGYVFAGLVVGLRTRQQFRDGAPEPAGSPMRSRLLYPVLYAGVAAAIGPASMAMHASTTTWGGQADVLSMLLWAAFVLSFGLARSLEWNDRSFLVGMAAIFTTAAYLYLGQPFVVDGTTVFGSILALYAVTEGWILFRRPERSADRRFLWLALAAFAAAFAIWLPSQTGGPLCIPESRFQGHAVWHLLTAVSVLSLYFFYDSERLSDPQSTTLRAPSTRP